MTEFSRDVLFSRMVGLVSKGQLDQLKNKKVAIPGCGGTGFTYAECLVRMGIGAINISDCDTFGPENMNRQFGCTTDTIGLAKVNVLHDRLKAINPGLQAQKFDAIGEANIDAFLDGVDVICDTMDFFVIEPRRLMYQKARERGIWIVICCPVAFGVTGHFFDPEGMSFDEFFGIAPDDDEQAKLVKFGTGLAPAELYKSYIDSPNLDFEAKTVSSLSASCLMATSWGATQALNILLGNELGLKPVPHCYNFDFRAGHFKAMHFPRGVHADTHNTGSGAAA